MTKNVDKTAHNWDVFFNHDILLWIPDSLKDTPVKWARILTMILSQIENNWLHSHTYMRLNTYYVPDKLEKILKPFQYEKIEFSKGTEHIYLIPDCSDQRILETVLDTGVVVDCGRTFFILDEKPENWRDSIDSLFNIAKSLSIGHTIKEFEGELTHCLCLCYSVDENLVIGKVNLPESTIISILEQVARNEGLILINHQNHCCPK